MVNSSVFIEMVMPILVRGIYKEYKSFTLDRRNGVKRNALNFFPQLFRLPHLVLLCALIVIWLRMWNYLHLETSKYYDC